MSTTIREMADYDLADCMGGDSSRPEAEVMRQVAIDRGYGDTAPADVPDDDWQSMLHEVVELTREADRYRVVKAGSLEVLSECDTWEQAVRCADESESCETQPEVYVERRVGGEWVGVRG